MHAPSAQAWQRLPAATASQPEEYIANQHALIADGGLCELLLQRGLADDQNFEAAQQLLYRHCRVEACLGAQPQPKMLAALTELNNELTEALIQLEIDACRQPWDNSVCGEDAARQGPRSAAGSSARP